MLYSIRAYVYEYNFNRGFRAFVADGFVKQQYIIIYRKQLKWIVK